MIVCACTCTRVRVRVPTLLQFNRDARLLKHIDVVERKDIFVTIGLSPLISCRQSEKGRDNMTVVVSRDFEKSIKFPRGEKHVR